MPRRGSRPALIDTAPTSLADWMEISAILEPNRQWSDGNTRQALVASGLLESGEEDAVANDALAEIADRESAAAGAYPFTVDTGIIALREPVDAAGAAYLFCLLASNAPNPTGAAGHERLFEQLCVPAAAAFTGGDSFHFGSPRGHLALEARPFHVALPHLLGLLGDGEALPPQPEHRNAKDGGLDILAWRGFPDRRAGRLMLWCQCAAGQDWDCKFNEANFHVFADRFLARRPVPDPVRALFVPFRVDQRKWSDISRRLEGIVFDRCRIAHTLRNSPAIPSAVSSWLRGRLMRLGASTVRFA